MSRPIVVTACMAQSSESGHPRRPWHLRAGGGAVHSIKSGHSAMRQRTLLFDHLVRELLEMQRHVEAQRLRSLRIDHQLELGRRLDRQLPRFSALEDAVDVL